MNVRIRVFLAVLLAAACPFPAAAKISATHAGSVVIGPSTDTCNSTNSGVLTYTTANDKWCYCDGAGSWKAFFNGAPSNGLVAYYKFDDASGTSAVDSTSNANTTSLFNTPTWTTGQISGALTLNGTTQYGTAANASQLDTFTSASGITLSAWVNLTSAAGAQQVVSKVHADGAHTSPYFAYSLGINIGQPRLWVTNSGGTGYDTTIGGAITIGTNAWHHLVGVWSGTTASVYVDGVFSTSTTTTGTSLANYATHLVIGANGDHTTENLHGKVDDVRVYNRALSAAEIANLYAWTGTCP